MPIVFIYSGIQLTVHHTSGLYQVSVKLAEEALIRVSVVGLLVVTYTVNN